MRRFGRYREGEVAKYMSMPRKRSIANLIFIVTTISPIITTLLIGCFMYFHMYRILAENAQADLFRSMNNVFEIASGDVRSLRNTYYRIISNDNLSSLRAGVALEEVIKSEEALRRLLLFDESWSNGLLVSVSVFIYGAGSPFISVTRTSYNMEHSAMERNIAYLDKDIKGQGFFTLALSSQKLIYAARTVYDWRTSERNSDIVLCVDADNLYSRYSGVLSVTDANVCLFDSSGRIYVHNDQSQIGEYLDIPLVNIEYKSEIGRFSLRGVSHYYIARDFHELGLSCMIYVPEKTIFNGLDSAIYGLFGVVFGIGVVFVILGILIGKWFTYQIMYFCEKLEYVQKGDYSIRIPDNRYDEINLLGRTYNNMADQIQILIREQYERQILIKEAQIKSLQSQMNPHFLFNVLMMIAWKARLMNNDDIYRMVNSLSELLRARILTDNREKISVSEELTYVDYYLMLQKERYGERITSEIIIKDDRILDYYIPKLSLQPIVENSIQHGLENIVEGGHVSLEAHIEGKILQFRIKDNGKGFNAESLNLDDKSQSHPPERAGIGLVNTHRRIQLIYGENYGLHVRSLPGKGTEVNIRLPFEHFEHKGEKNV